MAPPGIHTAPRYIAVAATSDFINNERGENKPRVYKDYALLKVLFMLGLNAKNESGLPVDIRSPHTPIHSFEWTGPSSTPLDFSGLKDKEVIFIAGHGNPEGLYAMGRKSDVAMTRLIQILTGDGNLTLKRTGKKTTIVLLSCRAGLGFHKSLARKLFNATNLDITVGGAVGFTFGSMETFPMGLNEVLPIGLPWWMEYNIPPLAEAEQHTSAREGRSITYARKQNEIDAFKVTAAGITNEMTGVINQLTSQEVNAAMAELLDRRFRTKWMALIRTQFELYELSRTQSDLEFDMWYPYITQGYVWVNASDVTDAQADSFLTGNLDPGHPELGQSK